MTLNRVLGLRSSIGAKAFLSSLLFASGLLCCISILRASGDARAHLGTGLKLFDMQNYSEAIKEFELALAIEPKLEDARYHLALSDFYEHRNPEARKQLDLLLKTGYRKTWVRYYLGRLDLLEGNIPSAIREFESINGHGPLYDEMYYLATAHLKLGKIKEAISCLKRQIAFNPKDFRAYNLLGRAYQRQGDLAQARKEFQKSQALHLYYAHAQQELMECRQELEGGDADQAWTKCGSALKTDDIDRQVASGQLFGDFHHYDQALQLFNRALDLDPDSAELNYDVGYAYLQKKQYAQAHKYLSEATRMRPNFFKALAMEGAALFMLHEDATALSVLQQAHQLQPDDPDVNQIITQLSNTMAK
jgi:tetratricopeptide (TPR) repeat protein